MNIQSVSTSQPPPSSPEVSGLPRETKVTAAQVQNEAASEKPAEPVSQEQLQTAINSVQEYIKPFNNNNLEFSVDKDTKQYVVKIIDSETKEVIRQMPSEEMIAIAKALDTLKGLFVKQQA